MSSSVSYNFLPNGETELQDDAPIDRTTAEEIVAPPPVSTPAEIREDLFGLKQGTPMAMAYEKMKEGDVDLDRPFDYTPDVDTQELPTPKDEITKETILEFWKYTDEAYFSKEKFDAKEEKYGDERDNSRLYESNGSECRVYMWDNKMVISFRGTDTTQGYLSSAFMSDILTDLSTKIQALDYIGIGGNYQSDYRGMVHQGFADYTMELYDELMNLIYSVYGDTVEELYVCGHSLGAIAGQIFSYKLMVEESIMTNRVYAYGSPTGIYTFGDVLENEMSIINILHTHDIVGYVAPFFQHHGYKVMIDLDNNIHVYKPFEDIPSHYYEKDVALAYALRKNGVYRETISATEDITSRVQQLQDDSEISPITDREYDKYVNSGTLAKNIDNVRSFLTSLLYKPQQKAAMIIAKILSEAGTKFYHTAYDEVLRKIPDTINLKPETNSYSYKPDLRLNHTGEKDRYEYAGSIGVEHLYKDLLDNKLITTKNKPDGIHITHLNKSQPLGIYFYEKDEDILNKAIVFYN